MVEAVKIRAMSGPDLSPVCMAAAPHFELAIPNLG
jgi:hypothetical protein